jgi:hypothetical protein
VVSARDSSDVRIIRHNKGLSRAERTTADLRKVTIEEVADRRYRVTVKLRRLAPSRATWDQATVIGLTEDRDDWPEAGVLFDHRGFTAFAFKNSPGITCELKVIRHPVHRALSVVVPKRCMPPEGWQGWVKTTTEIVDDPAAAEPTWTVFSRDFMRLPKLHYR